MRGNLLDSPLNNTIMFGGALPEVPIEDEEAEVDTREGWRLEAPPKETPAEKTPLPPPSLPVLPDTPPNALPAVPRLDESESLPTEAMPLLEQFAQAGQSPYVAPPTGNETLPKNWQFAGKLSAQLTADSVNLVAGERVRIPVSVRNESANPMQLRVHIAGLPPDWTAILDSIVPLMPGEILSVDVILETRAPFDRAYLDSLLRVHDQFSPDTYLTLPLRLNFKTSPNIVGRLSPTALAASHTTYLNLHNHTQVTINTFIAGHSASPDLHIIPAQAQLELPPGQNIEIPVDIRPLHRPWFKGHSERFSVSVRHGNRAALDYPAVARIRPRISFAAWVLLILLIAVSFAVWRLLGNNFTAAGVVETPAVITPSLPALVEATDLPTPEKTAESRAVIVPQSTVTLRPRPSATIPPSATPKPTNTSTTIPTSTITPIEIAPTSAASVASIVVADDPRPPGCTTAIPANWKLYTVQSGDRAFRLAVTYGTTVDEIASVNCLSDATMLQVGQVLLLPMP
jgi:LysM repeat protein